MVLNGEMKPIRCLTDRDKERMYQIMLKHYEGVSWDAFLSDMSEKDGILVFRNDNGFVQGFSTYLFMQTGYEGTEIVALFSGDTIIDRDYWGTTTLFNSFGRLLYRLMEESNGKKTYWFLTSKGYRTYLLLPLFFKEFYPRYDAVTPPYEKGLIDHLASMKYDIRYDHERGIILSDSYFLKGEFADIPEGKLRNQSVSFFVERNPGYVKGEDLACVCPIQADNFRKRTRMLVRP